MERRMNQSLEIVEKSKKNFGLFPEQFEMLSKDLRKGENRLFEMIYLAHFKKCQNFISKQFGIREPEAYDLTMDTLLIFRRGIMSGKIKYGNLEFLFTRMAYLLHLKRKKKLDKINKEEYAYLKNIEGKLSIEDKEAKLNQLEKAINNLNNQKQKFLQDHYQNKLKLTQMAKQSGESDSTIRKRKQRILEELRKSLNI